MIKKPIIGILVNMLITENGLFPGMKRAAISHDYVQAIVRAGGVPVLLPVVNDEESIKGQVGQVDGILLSGGYDVNPLLYGEEPFRDLDAIFPEVDEHHILSVKIAAALGKPMLGICRGLQVLNVAFGGTLYQDIAQFSGNCLKHFQKGQRHVPSHTVELIQDTVLSKIFAKDSIVTNSFHHQSVKDIAPGFVVNAKARDGIIEGIEKKAGTFILGVQWHPEMMADQFPDMLLVFKAFVDAAKKN
jgi:putative glutamine amidotransferase